MNMKRIFLLLLFFLALAIGAQAQIIKGAGILYFDSLVNVNANTAGAELAWSIKLKKGYRWDRTLGQWIEHPTFSAIDSTLANNGLALSGDTVQLGGTLTKNTEVDINGKTLRFRDAAGYPDLFMNGTYGLLGSDANTYLDVGSTSGRVRIVGASDAEVSSAGDALVSATDTVVVTGQRIRLNAADTRIQQVSKSNTLNRVMMIDSTTEQIYYRDVSSIAGGGGGSGTVTSITAGVGLTGGTITTSGTIAADTSGMLVSKSFLTNQGYTTNTGTVTGTGTTGTMPVWSSSTALGDSPLTVASGNVSVTGTGAFRLGNWTTAGRPGTPTSGMTGYNTTLGNYDFYGASAWKNFLESGTGNGLGTAGRFFYADANGRAVVADTLYWDSTNRRLGIGTLTPNAKLNIIAPTNTEDGNRVLSLNRPNAGEIAFITDQARFSTGNGQGFYPSTSTGAISRATNMFFIGNPSTTTDVAAFSSIPVVLLGRPIATNTNTQTSASGTRMVEIIATINPSAGDATFSMLSFRPIYNQTGTASGSIIGIDYNPTVTSVLGSHYAALFRSGSVGIGTATPSRTFHNAGETRLADLTTDTPTRIVGADADGDLGAIKLGTGLSLSNDTLNVTGGAGTTNLAFSGSSSPVTLTSDTGTDVVFAAGTGLALSQSGGTATYSRTYSLTHITISGGSTFFSTTPERPDNDTGGSVTVSTVGSDFGVSGSTLDYTGASGALLRVEGSVSFSVADDGDYYLSIFKEGTEIAATSTRISCVAGDYYTVGLPATTTTGATNDTFDVRIATGTGTSTTTMHRYGFIIERVY